MLNERREAKICWDAWLDLSSIDQKRLVVEHPSQIELM
jgi:hypothetical protein